MTMKIKPSEKDESVADDVSLSLVNKKLEAFVEIVLKKLVDNQQEIKKLKARVITLEKK